MDLLAELYIHIHIVYVYVLYIHELYKHIDSIRDSLNKKAVRTLKACELYLILICILVCICILCL